MVYDNRAVGVGNVHSRRHAMYVLCVSVGKQALHTEEIKRTLVTLLTYTSTCRIVWQPHATSDKAPKEGLGNERHRGRRQRTAGGRLSHLE